MRGWAVSAGLALLLPAASAAALPPEEETEHVVTEGETLYGIANRAKVSSDKIAETNGLEPPFIVRIGQRLTIPREGKSAANSGGGVSPETENEHLVRPGETLGGIAMRTKVPRVLIAEANGLVPPYTIRVGQKLVIPRTRHHTVKQGETGFSIAYAYAVPWADIAVANGIGEDDTLRAGQELLIPTKTDRPDPAASPGSAPQAQTRFIWPVMGPIRRGFEARGRSDYHDGIDVTAPEGTAVRAADAGVVIFARRETRQFGNLVVIDHGDGWASAYASLSRITVKRGHKVAKGERIGLVGDTSITKRTELHFELRRDGKAVDPLAQLPKAP